VSVKSLIPIKTDTGASTNRSLLEGVQQSKATGLRLHPLYRGGSLSPYRIVQLPN